MSNSSQGECRRQNYTNVVIRGACVQLLRGIGVGHNDFSLLGSSNVVQRDRCCLKNTLLGPLLEAELSEFLSWMYLLDLAISAQRPSSFSALANDGKFCVSLLLLGQDVFSELKINISDPDLGQLCHVSCNWRQKSTLNQLLLPYFPPTLHFQSSYSSMCIPQAVMPILRRWLNSVNSLTTLDWVTASDITLFLLHSCLVKCCTSVLVTLSISCFFCDVPLFTRQGWGG